MGILGKGGKFIGSVSYFFRNTAGAVAQGVA